MNCTNCNSENTKKNGRTHYKKQNYFRLVLGYHHLQRLKAECLFLIDYLYDLSLTKFEMAKVARNGKERYTILKNPYKAHPWHGIPIGEQAPELVNAFIEIVPADTVKYEIDKQTGYLKIDRPQKYSNIVPALYGFIPQTYCGNLIAQFAREKSGKEVEFGNGDPLDILVLCKKNIPHGDIICEAIPIGGLRLLDKGEADDKLIAVLKGDEVYGKYTDITELPPNVVTRLKHYF